MRKKIFTLMIACALCLSNIVLFAQKNGNEQLLPITVVDEQTPLNLSVMPTNKDIKDIAPASTGITDLRAENNEGIWFAAVTGTLVQPTATPVDFTVTTCDGQVVAQQRITYPAGRSCRRFIAILGPVSADQAQTLRWQVKSGAFPEETVITAENGRSTGTCSSGDMQANGGKSNGVASNLSSSGIEPLGGASNVEAEDFRFLFMSAVIVQVNPPIGPPEEPSTPTVNVQVRDCFNRPVIPGATIRVPPGESVIRIGPLLRLPVLSTTMGFLPRQPLRWRVTKGTDSLETITEDDGRSPGKAASCAMQECFRDRELAEGGDDVATQDSTADIEVEVQPGQFRQVHLRGPSLIRREPAPFQGQPAGICQIRTRIEDLQLVTPEPVPGIGRVQVTLQKQRPSDGLIVQERTGIDFPAHSFFDVFARIEIPNHPDPRLRVTINREATRVETKICDIPPTKPCPESKEANSNSSQTLGSGRIQYCNTLVPLLVRCRVLFCRLDDPSPPCNTVRQHCHGPRF